MVCPYYPSLMSIIVNNKPSYNLYHNVATNLSDMQEFLKKNIEEQAGVEKPHEGYIYLIYSMHFHYNLYL